MRRDEIANGTLARSEIFPRPEEVPEVWSWTGACWPPPGWLAASPSPCTGGTGTVGATSAGSPSRHAGSTAGQRSAKGQPVGFVVSNGGRPSSGTRRSDRGDTMFGMERSSPMVYGITGSANSGRTGAFSTILPAYMTATRSTLPATTPRSWVMRTTAAPVISFAVCSTSRICAWIVTSSAVVGSSARMSFGSFAIAIAIIARCRMPPENSCGNASRRRAAFGIPTMRRSSSARARAACFDRDRSCSWRPSMICCPIV